MIVSKQNLLAVEITKEDKAIPVLNTVHVDPAGATIGSNGRSVVCVTPVTAEVRKAVPLTDVPAEEMTLASDTVREILHNMHKDTLFKGLLEHCDLSHSSDHQDIQAVLTNGKRKHSIIGRLFKPGYIDYKAMLRRVLRPKGERVQLAVNLKRMVSLINTVAKMCPDTAGELPLFIEFSSEGELVLRARNHKTGQDVIAIMVTYKGAAGRWPEPTDWEQQFTRSKRRKVPSAAI